MEAHLIRERVGDEKFCRHTAERRNTGVTRRQRQAAPEVISLFVGISRSPTCPRPFSPAEFASARRAQQAVVLDDPAVLLDDQAVQLDDQAVLLEFAPFQQAVPLDDQAVSAIAAGRKGLQRQILKDQKGLWGENIEIFHFRQIRSRRAFGGNMKGVRLRLFFRHLLWVNFLRCYFLAPCHH